MNVSPIYLCSDVLGQGRDLFPHSNHFQLNFLSSTHGTCMYSILLFSPCEIMPNV